MPAPNTNTPTQPLDARDLLARVFLASVRRVAALGASPAACEDLLRAYFDTVGVDRRWLN